MNFVNKSISQDLEALVSRVSRLLVEIEHLDWDWYRGDDREDETRWQERHDAQHHELRQAVGFVLATLATRVAVYTDALGLKECRALLNVWQANWSDDKLAEVHPWNSTEGDGIESRPFNQLLQLVNGLLVLTRPSDAPPPEPVDRKDRERLEHALRSLAKICRDRNVTPSKEHDVQQVLHSHLEGVFADYARSPTIDKPLLNFKPDGAVGSLKAAIECKFVSSNQGVKTAIHGLTEDLSGYAGSQLYSHFFTVVYMTEPFATEGQFRRALGASGNAGNWTTIVVTGPGQAGPKKRNPTSRKAAAR